MPVDNWPASLPQELLISGYREAMGDGRLRSSMGTGPAKVRRRSSAMPAPVSGQVILTTAQLQTMRSFIELTLLGGSLPFSMGGRLVRFSADLPSWTPITPDLFTVSLSLEVLP